MLDDASYDNDASATAGTVSYASPVLSWSGNLAPGGSAVITYTVTVNDPDAGDKQLVNTVTSAAVGSTCPDGSTNPACSATIAVVPGALTITVPADAFYDVTALGQTTGTAAFTYAPVTHLTQTPQAVVAVANVAGNTTATWDPIVEVTVPGSAIGGSYTATITHSVSLSARSTGRTALVRLLTVIVCSWQLDGGFCGGCQQQRSPAGSIRGLAAVAEEDTGESGHRRSPGGADLRSAIPAPRRADGTSARFQAQRRRPRR